MNRRQIFPAVSIGFLAIMLLLSVTQFVADVGRFGWTYDVTTIIADVETTKTINVSYELVGCFFFAWFLLIAVQNFHLQRCKPVEEVKEPELEG